MHACYLIEYMDYTKLCDKIQTARKVVMLSKAIAPKVRGRSFIPIFPSMNDINKTEDYIHFTLIFYEAQLKNLCVKKLPQNVIN